VGRFNLKAKQSRGQITWNSSNLKAKAHMHRTLANFLTSRQTYYTKRTPAATSTSWQSGHVNNDRIFNPKRVHVDRTPGNGPELKWTDLQATPSNPLTSRHAPDARMTCKAFEANKEPRRTETRCVSTCTTLFHFPQPQSLRIWMFSVTPCLCRSRRTLTLTLLMWRIGWANSIPIYIQ
jgi:hypothetical protein